MPLKVQLPLPTIRAVSAGGTDNGNKKGLATDLDVERKLVPILMNTSTKV